MGSLPALGLITAAAFAGGYAFSLLGIPAPWLAGSMVATVAIVLLGRTADVPRIVRDAVFLVLGLQTGAAINWNIFGELGQWPASLVVLFVTVIAVSWSGMAFFRRFHGWDAPSAFYGSIPGALSLILALAEESGAHMARVTIVQSIRLICLVAALPILITFLAPGNLVVPHQIAVGSVADTALAFVVGAAVGYLFEYLKVPAGLLLGPAIANAALHLSGTATGALPAWLLVPSYVLLGVMIGVRFNVTSRAEVNDAAVAAMTSFPLALAVAFAGAVAAHLAAGVPLTAALVAFAPGGLDAMIVLAFALGLDPAYVGAHQLARYLGISFGVPVVAGLLGLAPEQQAARSPRGGNLPDA
ncbi:MAG: AbrB family transcriptional regulator [Hyphomicrobiales bacterium]